MSIELLRKEIDVVDDQLVALLKARFDLSRAIGEEKKKLNRPVYDAAREATLLLRLEEAAAPYGGEVRVLYERIMELSRKLQA
ncbi:chorismate mutase [Aedoeadaptatus pacaensis]|uniref:chorismate mutase n=1 Tax=Aedoeadaptatus pacaensis TaxID=1776390 RepID=UPI000838DDE3|nr:chorismate mutase [Peptoniphilus pacaensis]